MTQTTHDPPQIEDLRQSLQIGDEITYHGTPRTFTVRATSDHGITHTGGSVSWDAPGLRKVEPLTPRLEGPALDTPLTPAEREELAQCEAVIRANLDGTFSLACALRTIRDKRLHREKGETLEAYVRAEFGIGRSYAYSLMTAADVHQQLTESGAAPPANEAQARELAKVPESARAIVWREALAVSGGKPTAAVIAATLQEFREMQVFEWAPRDLATVLELDEATVRGLPVEEIKERLIALRLSAPAAAEPVISREADSVKQDSSEPAANLTRVEHAPETSAIADTDPAADQLAIGEVEWAPEHDYQGWGLRDEAEWDDPGTGEVRRGVAIGHWSGRVVVRATDGKPPKEGIPLEPEALRRPVQMTSTEIVEEARGAAPSVVKSAAEIAAERAAARTTKPGVLKSAEEKVQERHAPAPRPEGWSGKPVTALIPAALDDRLTLAGVTVVEAARAYCDLWESTKEFDVQPEAAVELLGRFLGHCRAWGRSPEAFFELAEDEEEDEERDLALAYGVTRIATLHGIKPEAGVEILERFLQYCGRLERTWESVLGEAEEDGPESEISQPESEPEELVIPVPADLLAYSAGDPVGQFVQDVAGQRPADIEQDVFEPKVTVWKGGNYVLIWVQGTGFDGPVDYVRGFELADWASYAGDTHTEPRWTVGREVRCLGLTCVLARPVRFVPREESEAGDEA